MSNLENALNALTEEMRRRRPVSPRWDSGAYQSGNSDYSDLSSNGQYDDDDDDFYQDDCLDVNDDGICDDYSDDGFDDSDCGCDV